MTSLVTPTSVGHCPPSKARFVRLCKPERGDKPGSLIIQVGKERHMYLYRSLNCQVGGAAYALRKTGTDCTNDLYHVRIDLHDDRNNTCDCAGHTYHGKCKHVDGLRKLASLGQL